MNLNELRDRAYKTACDHGFHDEELSNEHCLCLVISELMEAVEADRKGKRADTVRFKYWQSEAPGLTDEGRIRSFKEDFKNYIKDTIEDEFADACIRLLDLCGLRKIDIEDFTEEMLYGAEESCNDETFTESVYAISTIPIRYEYEYDYLLGGQLNSMLLAIFRLAKHLDIDLIWHINQKMRYNELRENKHGKNKHFPLRIDCRTVIYVTKDKLTPEYAEKKRKLFNSISAIEKKGGGYRVTVDVEEVRELVVSGMRLKDIAKKLGVSKTTVDNYIKKYDLRNGKR